MNTDYIVIDIPNNVYESRNNIRNMYEEDAVYYDTNQEENTEKIIKMLKNKLKEFLNLNTMYISNTTLVDVHAKIV